MLRCASVSSARSRPPCTGLVRVLMASAKKSTVGLGAQIVAAEGDQLAPDRDELAFAVRRERARAQQLAAPHRALGHAAQVPA